MPARDVAVIGGGAVGVAAAYSLGAAGARVVLLERQRLGRGCSYGNAGLVVPGHSLPLASPQALRQGLRWLLSGKGPFTLTPRADPALLRWLVRYLLACRTSTLRATIPALHGLAAASLDRYQALAEQLPRFGFERRGWLYVYLDPDVLAGELAALSEQHQASLRWEAVDAAAARALCPLLSERIVGGILYPAEAHLQPYAAVGALAVGARGHGAELREGAPVERLQLRGGRVTDVVLADGERLPVGWCVLATGAETPGLDLVGFRPAPDPRRLRAIRAAGDAYLPGLTLPDEPEAWCGFRPLSPDSRPIIGPAEQLPNLILATGHGQLGITLAPITGELVAAAVLGQAPPVEPSPFLPSRFGL